MGNATPDTRFPDFYIVGRPKSGTTAVYEMLRHHPQVFMPDLKEPHFFTPQLRDPPRFPDLPASEDAYLELFAPARATALVGEASATYLWSPIAAEAIARLRPDARIIVLLREPATFLYSWHGNLVRDAIEDEEDVRKALALEPERRSGRRIPPACRWPSLLFYSEHMQYVEQLRRFTEHFPQEQMIVLTYDELRRDNAETVRKTLRFLDLEDTIEVAPVEANVSYRVRSRRGERMIQMIAEGRGAAVKRVIKPLTTQQWRRAALDQVRKSVVYAKPRRADPDLMLDLRRRYRDEVSTLADFLGRDLMSEWGYDRL